MDPATKTAFWYMFEDGQDNPSIMSASLRNGSVHRLLRDVDVGAGLAIAGGYVYWSGYDWIGRIRVDGTDPDRHYLTVGHPVWDDIAADLETDGTYLYLARCLGHDAIGRIPIEGPGRHRRIQWLYDPECSQEITVNGDSVYWTSGGFLDDPGWIGRATVGGKPDYTWFNTGSRDPFKTQADGQYVYWSWPPRSYIPGVTDFIARTDLISRRTELRLVRATSHSFVILP